MKKKKTQKPKNTEGRTHTNFIQTPQRYRKKGIFLNSFHKASITLLPKPDKDITRK